MSENHRGTPAEIAKIIRRARNRPSFFVHGDTPLEIKGEGGNYFPLAGNVRVTRGHMLKYLADMQDTATRLENHRGVELEIKLSVHGSCYFV